jgi:hypothetical protein
LIQTEGSISLNPSEIKQAKEKAIEACGGNANDTACMEKQQQQIQQQVLEEKRNASNSTANIIKGRRLRIVVIEDGKRKVYQIPDGQTFNPEKLGLKFADEVAAPGQTTVKESSFTFPSIGDIVGGFFLYGGSFLLMFLYVVSILTTWQSFRKGGYQPKYAAIPTAIAVVLPGSGYIITLLYFLVVRYYLNTKNPIPPILKDSGPTKFYDYPSKE